MTAESVGYWILAEDGTVTAHGDAPSLPDDTGLGHGADAVAVDVAVLREGRGGCILDAAGRLHTWGDVPALGPVAEPPSPGTPAVGLAVADGGEGVWIAFADGTVVARGSADVLELTAPGAPDPPIVSITATVDGTGYWLLDAAGGVTAYGSATWHGNSDDMRRDPARAVGLAPLRDASGYWVVRQDGAVFCCGAAPFLGSPAGVVPVEAVAIHATPDDLGYWVLGRRGEVLPFGTARFAGDRDDGSRAAAMVTFEPVDRLQRDPGVDASIRAALTGERGRERPYLEAVEFTRWEQPTVSIVIPAHGQSELTARCLAAIASNSGDVEYEVIVVDDASADDTAAMLASIPGVRVITNDHNLGYVRSTNIGAAHARAPYIVLLNNDTEVRPGWLRALLDTAQRDPTIGIVGAKLLDREGLISEAGGIVWNDGNAFNVGRGALPTRPEYNWLRDVDYVSAACLLVRRDLWEKVGGFDEQYAPAYYEDLDLAFAARRQGYRVVYQPDAEVVHFEGSSHGTDEGEGIKRFQVLNRDRFVTKWATELRAQRPNDLENVLAAQHRRRNPQVLVVEAAPLTPDRDAGSRRMLHVLDALLAIGCTTSLALESAHEEGRDGNQCTTALQQRGVEVLFGPRNLERYLRALGDELDLCILSRPEIAGRYLPLVEAKAPGAVVAFDTVDLHFVRESRRAEISGDPGAVRAAGAYAEVERALARASDVTIVATESDAEKLRAVVGVDVETLVIPTVHPVAPAGPAFDERSGLLFVGSFRHLPNVDAVEWFVREILPSVQDRLPGVRLSIVGAEAPPTIEALSSDHVEVRGWVPDLEPVYARARLVVAPLRYGSGMKGKIGEALSYGVPVVTTSVGNEGTGLVVDREVLVADDPGDFADAVVTVYKDPMLWSSLASAGREAAERLYSPAVVRTRIERLITKAKTADHGRLVEVDRRG